MSSNSFGDFGDFGDLGDFGSVQDDIIGILAIGYGGDRKKAATKFNELVALLRKEAEAGALQSVPKIEAAVTAKAKATITPYVFIALGLGVLGLLIGVGTLIYVRKKHP
jgi:hypothetical protein